MNKKKEEVPDWISNLADKYAREILGELQGDVPQPLKTLFEIEKKSDLIKYTKDLIIQHEDFARLVHNCHRLGYKHSIQSNQFSRPEHNPTDEELDGLRTLKAGEPFSGMAKRFVTKLRQLFEQRRFLVAHIFHSEKKWHIFYFDQRDLQDFGGNHWKEGAHIHFVNHLWPNYDPRDL